MVVWRSFVLIKGISICTKIRSLSLRQARGLRFTKIDNNFAFFDLRQTRKTGVNGCPASVFGANSDLVRLAAEARRRTGVRVVIANEFRAWRPEGRETFNIQPRIAERLRTRHPVELILTHLDHQRGSLQLLASLNLGGTSSLPHILFPALFGDF